MQLMITETRLLNILIGFKIIRFPPLCIMILKPFFACEYSRRKRFRELPDMVDDMIGEALKDC